MVSKKLYTFDIMRIDVKAYIYIHLGTDRLKFRSLLMKYIFSKATVQALQSANHDTT